MKSTSLNLKAIDKKMRNKRKEKELSDLYNRAFKGLPRPKDLAGELSGLERYLVELRKLNDEVSRRYGDDPHFQNSFYWLNKELDSVASEIIRKKIQQLQADRLGL